MSNQPFAELNRAVLSSALRLASIGVDSTVRLIQLQEPASATTASVDAVKKATAQKAA